MRHLNHDESLMSPGDYYTLNTRVERRASYVRMFSDGIVPLGYTLTLEQWKEAAEKVNLPA